MSIIYNNTFHVQFNIIFSHIKLNWKTGHRLRADGCFLSFAFDFIYLKIVTKLCLEKVFILRYYCEHSLHARSRLPGFCGPEQGVYGGHLVRVAYSRQAKTGPPQYRPRQQGTGSGACTCPSWPSACAVTRDTHCVCGVAVCCECGGGEETLASRLRGTLFTPH